MSKQAINPNNLPVVQVVQNETADLSDSISQVVMTSIYNGDDTLCVSKCLVPQGLKDYDFVWMEPMAVEAMWLDNELLIDRSEPSQPFTSPISFKVISWLVDNPKVMLLIPGGLVACWLVNEFGMTGAIINVIVWGIMVFLYRSLNRHTRS